MAKRYVVHYTKKDSDTRLQCKGCDSMPDRHDTLEGYCMVCVRELIRRALKGISMAKQNEIDMLDKDMIKALSETKAEIENEER